MKLTATASCFGSLMPEVDYQGNLRQAKQVTRARVIGDSSPRRRKKHLQSCNYTLPLRWHFLNDFIASRLVTPKIMPRSADSSWRRLLPGPPKAHRRHNETVRLLLIGGAVFIIALAISLGVYFAALAAERRAAGNAFTAAAEDLASRILQDHLSHARDFRILSERTGRSMELAGALPSRRAFQRIADSFRTNPVRLFTGLGLAVNVSAAERDRFEAALTAENGVRKTLWNPMLGPNSTVPAASWYVANAIINTPQDPAKGYDKIRPGWTWTSVPELRDVLQRASRSGRSLSSSPLAMRE